MTNAGLQAFRTRVQAQMETFFPTTIVIDGSAPLAAARYAVTQTGTHELAGLLAGYDVAFRVRRELLTGVTITQERSVVTEGAARYRVEKIHDAAGDPALLLGCKSV